MGTPSPRLSIRVRRSVVSQGASGTAHLVSKLQTASFRADWRKAKLSMVMVFGSVPGEYSSSRFPNRRSLILEPYIE